MSRSEIIARAACAALFVVLIGCTQKIDETTLVAYARAAAAFDAGRLDEAAALSSKLRSFYPAVILFGKTRWFAGDGTEAEAAFRSALRLRPSSSEARLGLARVLRSRTDNPSGSEEAAGLVEAVLADDASDTRALRLAAELAMDREKPEEAAAYLDRAVEAAAETGLAFLDRARLLWAAGDGEGAIHDVRAAIAVLPPNSAASRAARSLEAALEGAQQGKRP